MPIQNEAPKEKISLKKRDLVIVVVGLLVLLAAILYTLDRIRNRHDPTPIQKESSASASPAYCKDKLTFENQKHGYKICLETDYTTEDQSDHKIGSEVLLRPRSTASASAKPQVKILVTNPVNRTTKPNLKNYSEKVTEINEQAGLISIYTLANENKVIETSFDHFRRTFQVRMESTVENFDTDLLTYNAILGSWLFLPGTIEPPWALSGNLYVNKPWPGDSIANPFTMEGRAQVFEGVVNIRVKDSAGNILINTIATTSSGTQLSAFTKSISYPKPATSRGVIEVFSLSARDGAEQDKIVIPITFNK